MGMISTPSFPLLVGLPILPSTRLPPLAMAASSSSEAPSTQSASTKTKLLTFLGKGGSGKTTAAIFAAQHYAMAGMNTCLVIQGQDTTADYLLNCKIGSSHIVCSKNLSAVRLETTKMLLEPLKLLKQADAQLNLTQGSLGGIVGEELGILPGMDSILLVLALERLVGFSGIAASKSPRDKFDVIVYDGISSEETLRFIGASSKARLYLKYLRNLADKTDLGRLAAPSLLRLVDEAMRISSSRSLFSGSSEIWDTLEEFLERASSAFSNPQRFSSFLVMDPNNPTTVNSALRYWGCTIQAGAQVSGAFGVTSLQQNRESLERAKKDVSPLPSAFISSLSMNSPIDWSRVLLDTSNEDARRLLTLLTNQSSSVASSVKFDRKRKLVTLFMPGFDKSEIKLYQYRGGSELLVEAGDQRRVIPLPSEIQGKILSAGIIPETLNRSIYTLKYLHLCDLDFNESRELLLTLCLLKSSPRLLGLFIKSNSVAVARLEPKLDHLKELEECESYGHCQLRTVEITVKIAYKDEHDMVSTCNFLIVGNPYLQCWSWSKSIEYTSAIEYFMRFVTDRTSITTSRS